MSGVVTHKFSLQQSLHKGKMSCLETVAEIEGHAQDDSLVRLDRDRHEDLDVQKFHRELPNGVCIMLLC